MNLLEHLKNTSYPGRGIAIERSKDGSKTTIIYFIMGRSVNSRNRVFEVTSDGIRTKAYDESKMEDPSLIIYHPVRRIGGTTIVTNGDQTDTIRDFLESGKSFEEPLRTREFEPDGPAYTPRISGILYKCGGYKLSILKSADGNADSCRRFFFEYDKPLSGQGHFISTYMDDGNPLPSFKGEPLSFDSLEGTSEEIAVSVWESLNADNKVSLYVSTIDHKSGKRDEVIINRNK